MASRQDRIGQLFSLLEEAEQNNDSDKIMEIKLDLFREFGIEKNMGGMMSMENMTMPLGYDRGTRDGTLVGDKEAMIKAFNLAKANNPDTRISEKDLEFAKKQISGMATIDDLISNKENRIKKEGRVSDMDRMMMLQASMRDEENQIMTDPDITSVALQIAKQQGDSSEKNINLIIDQLTALMPSLTKTMEKELTPLSTQGLKYLFDKMNIMAGKKSDPMLRRDVGFERVE